MTKEMISNKRMTQWCEVPTKRNLRSSPISLSLSLLLIAFLSPLSSPFLLMSCLSKDSYHEEPASSRVSASHSPLDEGHWWSVCDFLLRGRLHSPNKSTRCSWSKPLHGGKRPQSQETQCGAVVKSKASGIRQTGILRLGWTLWVRQIANDSVAGFLPL